jgi:hypothetical protein
MATFLQFLEPHIERAGCRTGGSGGRVFEQTPLGGPVSVE